MESTQPATPETPQESPLQRGVDQSLTSIQPLFKLKKTRDLAKTLGLKNGQILTWLWKTKSQHYSLQRIRKRSGGFRSLHIPSRLLRDAQHRILTRLLNKLPIQEYLWAFEKGKSVNDMAALHVGKDCVISIDLEDYFGKVHTRHIEPILNAYGIEANAGRVVTELCCYKFFLPQGGITSPKLSNLVAAHTFGPKLKEYADQIGATITIYADDVTLSFNGYKDAKLIVSDMAAILKEHGGFTVNEKKTKVMTKGHRQFVCGVVVNNKPNLAREERNRLRAIINNIEVHGLRPEAEKNDLEPSAFLASIKGRLNWYKQLNPVRAEKLSVKLAEALVPKQVVVQEEVA